MRFSLEQFAELLETSCQGMCVVDRDLRVRAHNDEFARISASLREDLRGVPLKKLFGDDEALVRTVESVWEEGEWEGEVELPPYECARVPAYVRGKRLSEGSREAVVLVFRDLLEQKVSARRSEHERLNRAAFFDAVSSGLFRIRLDRALSTDWAKDRQREWAFQEGRLIECNETGAAQIGRGDPEEVQGTLIRELLPREGYEIADRFVEADLRLEGERIRVECEGEERFYHLNLIGLEQEGGLLEEIWVSAFEVTEQVRRETQFARRLEERKQALSRKLHDEVSPYVTGARIFAERLEEEYDREYLHLLKDYLEKVRDQIAHMHRDIRPPSDGEPLGEIVSDLVSQHDKLGDIDFGYQGSYEAGCLDRETTAHLYRIVQEALRNAVRHSRADRVVVRIEERGERLRLEIADDGIGFDPAEQARSSGLANMRYRADAVGASLDISSTLGEGTTVTCELDRPPSGSDGTGEG